MGENVFANVPMRGEPIPSKRLKGAGKSAAKDKGAAKPKQAKAEAALKGARVSSGKGTVTITAPGSEPVTMTDEQLKQVAEKLAETSNFKMDETTREKLRQTVAKIERLEKEKKEIGGLIKEVYGEAKSFGFDTQALRAVIRERKIEKSKRDDRQMMLDLYMEVVGG